MCIQEDWHNSSNLRMSQSESSANNLRQEDLFDLALEEFDNTWCCDDKKHLDDAQYDPCRQIFSSSQSAYLIEFANQPHKWPSPRLLNCSVTANKCDFVNS